MGVFVLSVGGQVLAFSIEKVARVNFGDYSFGVRLIKSTLLGVLGFFCVYLIRASLTKPVFNQNGVSVVLYFVQRLVLEDIVLVTGNRVTGDGGFGDLEAFLVDIMLTIGFLILDLVIFLSSSKEGIG